MSSPAMNSPVMSKRMTRWLLALYPRAWRDRYGAEVTSLTDELLRAGETTPLPAGLNLVAGAAVERARALAASRTALTLSSAAVIVALVGGAFTLTGGARPTSGPHGLASASCLMEPALGVSVSPASTGRPRAPAGGQGLKIPPQPGRALAFHGRPPVMIVRLGRGGRILRLARPGRAAVPVQVLTLKSGLGRAAKSGLGRAAERKLALAVGRRLAPRSRTVSALMAKPRLAPAGVPDGSRTWAPQPVWPAEPAWAGPVARSCQQVTAVPNPVSGRTQKLRSAPPVPVATRTTR